MFTTIIVNVLELFTTLKPSSALFTLDCVSYLETFQNIVLICMKCYAIFHGNLPNKHVHCSNHNFCTCAPFVARHFQQIAPRDGMLA